MRLIFTLLTLAVLGFGGWYAWQRKEMFQELLDERLPISEFHTLEIRFPAEELMKTQKGALLKNSGYSYLEPKLFYYPYLLMDIKYSKGKTETCEGILLWGLNDGEMVINTGTWEKTHGYEDCLVVKADKNDFKILEALLASGGSIEREKLYQKFTVDEDAVDSWVDRCREKKLIIVNGNQVRLHFQCPLLKTEPITILEQPLVTQPAKNAQKVKGQYTSTQIGHLAQTAFGNDFAIRKTQEVYLPVFALSVQNPDGSILTTYWNALNGKKFEASIRR